MELGFVLSALRRRWWVVVVTTVLFGGLSSIVFAGSSVEYQSQAVLLVSPNSRGGVVQSTGDANRYVQGQMSAMNSETFQESVAERVNQAGGNESVTTVDLAVVLSNSPNTDIVTIDVFTAAPDRSTAIADAFAAEYLEQLAAESETDQSALVRDIEAKREQLGIELQAANQAIADSIAPNLDRLIASGANVDPVIFDPINATLADLLFSELDKIVSQQIALTSGDEIQVNSSIVQVATRGAAPIVESNTLQVAAGLVGGFGLGCLIALLWNRFSSRVSDESMVSEILGLPIAANVPRTRALAKRQELALLDPPEPIRGGIGRIAVAAEAKGPVHRPTRIVVAGAQRGSGTSTLAMLIAHEFSTLDTEVALVDANPRSRQLLSIIGHVDATFGDLGLVPLDRFDSEVVVVAPSPGDPRIRRADVSDFLESVGQSSRVVVIDAGSVLSSAATVELCEQADAVVLAVPTNRQSIATLQAVARAVTRDDALVVTTAPRRSAHGDSIAMTIPDDHTDPLERDPVALGAR